MRRGDHGGVDGRVKISLSQPEQVLVAGTVSVQCLGTRPGLAAQPPREGRDVVATPDRFVHDGTPQEPGTPENKKSHGGRFCRARRSPRDASAESALLGCGYRRSVRDPLRRRLSAGNVSRRRKDGVAWIVARCSWTPVMCWRMARWPSTELATGSPFLGLRRSSPVFREHSPGSDRPPAAAVLLVRGDRRGPSQRRARRAGRPAGLDCRLGRIRPGRREGVESEIHRDPGHPGQERRGQ